MIAITILIKLDIPLQAWQVNLDQKLDTSKNSVQFSCQTANIIAFYGDVPSGPVLAERQKQFKQGFEFAMMSDWSTASLQFIERADEQGTWIECHIFDYPWFWIGPTEATQSKLSSLDAAQVLALQLLDLKQQIGPALGPFHFLSPPLAANVTVSVCDATVFASSVLHPMISNQLPVGTRVRLKNLYTGYSVVCTNIALGPLEDGVLAKVGDDTWRYLGVPKDRKTFALVLSSFMQDDLPL